MAFAKYICRSGRPKRIRILHSECRHGAATVSM